MVQQGIEGQRQPILILAGAPARPAIGPLAPIGTARRVEIGVVAGRRHDGYGVGIRVVGLRGYAPQRGGQGRGAARGGEAEGGRVGDRGGRVLVEVGGLQVAEVLCGRRHHGRLDGGSAAGAGNAGGAVGGEAHEARADAVGEGLDEVGEAVADVHVVDDALAERGDGVAEEVEGDGDVFFGGAEGEGFEQDDGDADDAEEGSDGRVAEVAAGVESFDYDLEDVAGRVDDFVDVVSVIGVPLD